MPSGKPVPFLVEKVDIISSYSRKRYSIVNGLTDIEIFEHLERPYLTGQLAFVDTDGFLEQINFSGTDIVEILISVNPNETNQPGSWKLNKKFVIDEIIDIKKNEQGINLVQTHFIELHGFLDRVTNGCCSVGGKRLDMIGTILNNFLAPSDGQSTEPGLQVICTERARYNDVERRYIVPQNTTPLQACEIIRKYDTTEDGYPYYLFSTISNDALVYKSLRQILEDGVYFKNSFVWNGIFSAGESGLPYAIDTWKSNKTLNYIHLARDGLFGSIHDFYDPNDGVSREYKYDLSKAMNPYDVVEDAANLPTVHITTIMPNNTFSGIHSLQNLPEERNYQEVIFGSSLKGIMSETSIEIGLRDAEIFLPNVRRNSRGGLDPRTETEGGSSKQDEARSQVNNSATIGKKINVKFHTSANEQGIEDPKMSGNYFIYATRFIFKRNVGNTCTGNVILTCCKLFANSEYIGTTFDNAASGSDEGPPSPPSTNPKIKPPGNDKKPTDPVNPYVGQYEDPARFKKGITTPITSGKPQ